MVRLREIKSVTSTQEKTDIGGTLYLEYVVENSYERIVLRSQSCCITRLTLTKIYTRTSTQMSIRGVINNDFFTEF